MAASPKRKERRSQFNVEAAVKSLKRSVNVNESDSDDGDDDGEARASTSSTGGRAAVAIDDEAGDGESEDYGDSEEEDMDSSDGDDDDEAEAGGAPEPVDNSMAMSEALGKVLRKTVDKSVPILSKSSGHDKLIEEEKQLEQALRIKVRQTKALQQVGRVKPARIGTEKDRKLAKLATKGAVRLFNAVNDQQKVATAALAQESSKTLTTKKEKAIKEMSKETFLTMLTNKTKDREVDDGEATTGDKDTRPAYMRDDFMMKAKVKDWDKEDKVGDGDAADEVPDEEMPDADDGDAVAT